MDEPVDVDEVKEEKEELEGETEQSEGQEEESNEVPEEEEEELEIDEDSEFVEAKEKGGRLKKEEIEEENIVEERFYTIPLRKAWIYPRKKRAPKATRILRSFVLKHMKVRTEAEGEEEPEHLVIDNEVNEILWSRGIEKPPRKIRVRVIKDKDGVVTVLPAEGD
jgi:large subunit ribosomal protein L31e